jgi:hypothetical protein
MAVTDLERAALHKATHRGCCGVHLTGFDAGTRKPKLDEVLGPNCAWYADILLTLTECQPSVDRVQVQGREADGPARRKWPR